MEDMGILSIVELIVAPIVTAVIGYFTGHRKRKNDFLADLQGSIDMLSAKNRDLMDEVIKLRDQVVTLRAENLDLTKAQERLLKENAALREEVAHLRDENARQSELIEQLQQQLSGIRTITRTKAQ